MCRVSGREKNLQGKWSQRTQTTATHSGRQDMVAELSQEAAFLCRAEALVVKDGWHVKTLGWCAKSWQISRGSKIPGT